MRCKELISTFTMEAGLVIAALMAVVGVVQWKRQSGRQQQEKYILDYAGQVSELESQKREEERQQRQEEEQKKQQLEEEVKKIASAGKEETESTEQVPVQKTRTGERTLAITFRCVVKESNFEEANAKLNILKKACEEFEIIKQEE